MKRSKLILGVALAVIVGLVIHFDLHQVLTLAALKSSMGDILAFQSEHPVMLALMYVVAYIAVAGFSIPGATVLTLAGGAVFGVALATVLIVVGATMGATLAFLSSRFILRASLESKYAATLKTFNEGLEKNAMNYVLFLRMVPLFPFFLINLVLGLTRLRVGLFFVASAIGMLPGIIVYANAGRQLSAIQSLGDIASPQVLGAFVLLGCFSLIPIAYNKLKK
ncbi:TVP38/TMEM64 family protein [bacterium]|jgi:uncharacterized membrane protein YdjX (TVP38/TMEM64 family)|nr:TVP38/TMEM64 family protein [bacterium]